MEREKFTGETKVSIFNLFHCIFSVSERGNIEQFLKKKFVRILDLEVANIVFYMINVQNLLLLKYVAV